MTRNNESAFESSWRRYALAGTALLAGPALEAAVITSGPLNQSLSAANDVDSFLFDFDGDGNDDLRITAYDFDDGDGGGFERGVGAESLNGDILLRGFEDYPYFAKALGGGQIIDGNGDFYYYGYLLKDYASSRSETFTAQALRGEWPNDVTQFRFLGFRFFNNQTESVHYGWMKIAVQLGSADASIVEWAYEDQNDVAITTPRDGDVPEPSSLALLALGATGVAALKRRRKQ